MSSARRSICLLAALVVVMALGTAQAAGSPGAYKVLLTEPYESGPVTLGKQIVGFPGFVSFDTRDTSKETPSAAELAPYDAVVSVGDSSYLDRAAWGESLAAYLDLGYGVVVQFAYDNWEQAFPEGRFASGGYAPFIPGDNENFESTLGAFDPADPLMQGVTTMTTLDNTTPTLAPGARLVASWANGKPAIAAKGRVVSVSGWAGDDYGPGIWSGDYGRIVVNAVRTLGAQGLTVLNANPRGGTVTSSAGGISCGATCTASLPAESAVSLTAAAKKGFAFAGFGGDCAGPACALTMSGGTKTVSANFLSFRLGKVKGRNLKKGRAVMQIAAGGPGRVVVFGKRIKVRAKNVAAAGVVALPIIAKGKASKALNRTGKAKVGVRLAFIPSGGAKSLVSRPLTLRKKLG